MRFAVAFALALLAVPVWAGDGREIFQGVLQNFLSEIDRQQQRDAYRRDAAVRALVDDCFAGNSEACTQALSQPLTDSTRQSVIARLEALAEDRRLEDVAYHNFLENWNACHYAGNIGACDFALAYEKLQSHDRERLLNWRHDAVAQAEDAASKSLDRPKQQGRLETETDPVLETSATTASLPSPEAIKTPPLVPLLPFAAVMTVLFGFAYLIASRWTKLIAAIFGDGQHHDPVSSDNNPDIDLPFLFPLSGDFPTDIRRALAN